MNKYSVLLCSDENDNKQLQQTWVLDKLKLMDELVQNVSDTRLTFTWICTHVLSPQLKPFLVPVWTFQYWLYWLNVYKPFEQTLEYNYLSYVYKCIFYTTVNRTCAFKTWTQLSRGYLLLPCCRLFMKLCVKLSVHEWVCKHIPSNTSIQTHESKELIIIRLVEWKPKIPPNKKDN